MKFPILSITALAALCASPVSAVVYNFEYSGAGLLSPPDPVEGKVYGVSSPILTMSVHGSLLDFSDSSTARLSWYWQPFDGPRLFVDNRDQRVDGTSYNTASFPGFSLYSNGFLYFNEFELTFNTLTLEVSDWRIYFYDETGDDYFSTPQRRTFALFLGDDFYDPGSDPDWKFVFSTSVPGEWTVARDPPHGSQTPSPIPLPAGLPLMATALLALGLWRRRSRAD